MTDKRTGENQPLAKFQYQPLDHGDDIRLIKILPGEFSDDIAIEILHTALHEPATACPPLMKLHEIRRSLPTSWQVFENAEGRFVFTPPGTEDEVWSKRTWTHPDPRVQSAQYLPPSDEEHWAFEPSYEALSYAWGSSSTPCRVFIHAPEAIHSTFLDIGRSLFQALRHLRQVDRPRLLWVDKVCINQDDSSEKSSQVRRMSTIYRLARRVVVWLGLADQKAGKVIQFLREAGMELDCSSTREFFSPVGATEPFNLDARVPPQMWPLLDDFLERPWFDRLWPLQEINLANKQYAMIQCGSKQLPWYLFIRGLCALVDREEIPPAYVSSQMENLIERSSMSSSRPLSELLLYTAHLKCMDKRDMVYGVLGLAPLGFARSTLPDYTRSVEDVYRAAFLSHLRLVKRWEIIGCDWHERSIAGPSWVPDLSVYRICAESVCQAASGPSELAFSLDGDVLTVAGVRCATISWVGDGLPDSQRGTAIPLAKAISSWSTKIGGKANDPYLTGGTNLDAFVLTMAHGDVVPRRMDGPAFASLEEWKDMVDSILKSSGKAPQILRKQSKTRLVGSDIGSSLLENCMGRRFMVSKEGHFGLAPLCASPGDIICIILGLDRPLILRPMPDATYRVIGCGYLHGVQDATALLGPLPGAWRARFQDSKSPRLDTVMDFVNDSTQESTYDDPRLEPHPDWERVSEGIEGGLDLSGDDPIWFSFFRHKVTGEIRNSDPRLDVDALKARGVPIEHFALV